MFRAQKLKGSKIGLARVKLLACTGRGKSLLYSDEYESAYEEYAFKIRTDSILSASHSYDALYLTQKFADQECERNRYYFKQK